jgi:light-regulated signal transduction histidine kinase (bacteriophytochrome)
LKDHAGAKLDDQDRDYLDRMGSAASRMQAMIDSLLAFTRVTTQPGSTGRVDLSQVIDEVLGELEIRIEQSQGSVEVGELPVIEADPLQMRQLFQNLIANALKFHQPGVPPVVRIHSRRILGPVEIMVEDNGPLK